MTRSLVVQLSLNITHAIRFHKAREANDFIGVDKILAVDVFNVAINDAERHACQIFP
jgi:hypothetical protein